MKRNTLFIASALFGIALSAAAQDTIYTRVPLSNCYYSDGQWPNLKNYAVRALEGTENGAESWALQFSTEDTLTVYGIAVSMISEEQLNDFNADQLAEMAAVYGVTDFDGNYAYEYLRLYKPSADSLIQLGEDLYVKPNTQVPQYVIDIQMVDDWMHLPAGPIPVYERYFEHPIQVTDTFYVGRTLRTGQPYYDQNGERKEEAIWTCAKVGVRPSNQSIVQWKSRTHYLDGSWRSYDEEIGFWYLFPIIEPNPDTSTTDTTHAGIGRLTPVERNTVVSPNPATGTVRVASGFGLQHIEVYDEVGRRVYDAEASGMQAHIDVGSWPRGAYTVHVRTAVGTAIKKLLVQ